VWESCPPPLILRAHHKGSDAASIWHSVTSHGAVRIQIHYSHNKDQCYNNNNNNKEEEEILTEGRKDNE
jgi:hypothetical protein